MQGDVTWVRADATTWQPPQAVDLVVMAYFQVPADARRRAVRSAVKMLRPGGTLLLVAHGAEGEGTMARRGAEALARLLGMTPVVFPGDHGGFTVSEWSPHNDPAAFAARLKEVLAGA